jgi:adenosine kinase
VTQILVSIFREGTLLGLGNPLLDISVEPEYLEKNELKADNAILAEDKHSHIFKELQTDYKSDYIDGGSVQNTLRACQWIINDNFQKKNITKCFTVFKQNK